MTVLLLEGDPERRAAFREALVAAGAPPVVVGDAAEACDKLAEGQTGGGAWAVAVLDSEALTSDAWARITQRIADGNGPRVMLLCAPPPSGAAPQLDGKLPRGSFDRLFRPVTPRRLAALVRREAHERKVVRDEQRWRDAELAYHQELERDSRALEERIRKINEAPRLRRERAGRLSERVAETLVHMRDEISRAIEEDSLLETSCRSALEDAVSATERLVRMSQDLRDLNLAAQGTLHPDVVDVDIAELLQRAVSSQLRLAGDFHARLQLQLEGELGLVPADREFVRRIVLNLIERAVRQSRHGAVVVTARRSAREVQIAITDSGLPIPDELRERVFDADVRLLPLGNIFHRGMALPFCHAAVESQGGRIWADRGPSGGTCFRVALGAVAVPRLQEVARRVA